MVNTVEGKGGGSTKAYLHMAFDSINNVDTIQTCMEPDMMPNPWSSSSRYTFPPYNI